MATRSASTATYSATGPAARHLAEAVGCPAVTMRRLAEELGLTQPVLYSAFASRQCDAPPHGPVGLAVLRDRTPSWCWYPSVGDAVAAVDAQAG